MTKLEKLYSIIENSREVGVKLSKDVLQQVEELEEGIIKEEILPALGNDIAPRLEPIKRDLVLVVEYHPGEPISVALSRKTKISEIMGAKTLTPRSSTPVKSDEEPTEVEPHVPTKHIENTTKGMRVTFPDGTVIWHRQAIDLVPVCPNCHNMLHRKEPPYTVEELQKIIGSKKMVGFENKE